MSAEQIKEAAKVLHTIYLDTMNSKGIVNDALTKNSADAAAKASQKKHLADMWDLYTTQNTFDKGALSEVLDLIAAEIQQMKDAAQEMICEVLFPDIYKAVKAGQPTKSGKQQPIQVVVTAGLDWVQILKQVAKDPALHKRIREGPLNNVKDADKPALMICFILCVVDQPRGMGHEDMKVVQAAGFKNLSWKGFCTATLRQPGVSEFLDKEFPESKMKMSFGKYWPDCEREMAAANESNTKRRLEQLDLLKQEKELKK